MRALFITGGNKDPRKSDNWEATVLIEEGSDATIDQLIEMCDEKYCGEGRAIWLYEGDNYEDLSTGRALASGTVVYDMRFHPWDTDDVRLIREAGVSARDRDEGWLREIAMEEGMLHGVDAYNEVMGY